MAPQTPVGRINKDLRVHFHVEPAVCNPPTGKYERMGFICLNDAELEILIKRGARNRLPLAHGSPLRNQRDHGAKPSGGPCDLSIGRRLRLSTGAMRSAQNAAPHRTTRTGFERSFRDLPTPARRTAAPGPTRPAQICPFTIHWINSKIAISVPSTEICGLRAA